MGGTRKKKKAREKKAILVSSERIDKEKEGKI